MNLLLSVSVLVFAVTVVAVVATATASGNQPPSSSCAILKPSSAIITRHGGSIAVMRAELATPITTPGMHEICLSWCTTASQYECLNNNNNTNTDNGNSIDDCDCVDPPRDVEESVSFAAVVEQEGGSASPSSTDSASSSSPSAAVVGPCRVISGSWSHNKQFRKDVSLKLKDIEARSRATELKLSGIDNVLEQLRSKMRHLEREQNLTSVANVGVYVASTLAMQEQIDGLEEMRLQHSAERESQDRQRMRAARLWNTDQGRQMTVKIVCEAPSSSGSGSAKQQQHGNNNNNNNKPLLTELAAQVVLPDSTQYQKLDTVYISTAAHRQSTVALSASITSSILDMANVSLSLRGGEDNSGTEPPVGEASTAEPWVLKLATHAEAKPGRNNVNNEMNNMYQKTRKKMDYQQQQQDSSGSNSKYKQRESMANPVYIYTEQARTASFTASASGGAWRGGDMMMDAEDANAGAPSALGDDVDDDDEGPASVKIDRDGDFGETAKLPYLVTLPRKTPVEVELAQGSITLRQMLRVAATYLCKNKKVCTKAVHLRANVTNPNAFSILGGRAKVFLDGVPVRNRFLPETRAAIAAGGSGTLSLGEDPGVVVTRRERSSTLGAKSGAFFSFSAEQDFADVMYDISVQNKRATPVEVEVRELLPRTQSEHVVIKIEESTLKHPKFTRGGGKLAAAAGGGGGGGEESVSWNLVVPAGATVRVPFGFSVLWPKGKFVHGLV